MNTEQIKKHISSRKLELRQHEWAAKYIESLAPHLREKPMREVLAVISSNMAQCAISIRDHERLIDQSDVSEKSSDIDVIISESDTPAGKIKKAVSDFNKAVSKIYPPYKRTAVCYTVGCKTYPHGSIGNQICLNCGSSIK